MIGISGIIISSFIYQRAIIVKNRKALDYNFESLLFQIGSWVVLRYLATGNIAANLDGSVSARVNENANLF